MWVLGNPTFISHSLPHSGWRHHSVFPPLESPALSCKQPGSRAIASSPFYFQHLAQLPVLAKQCPWEEAVKEWLEGVALASTLGMQHHLFVQVREEFTTIEGTLEFISHFCTTHVFLIQVLFCFVFKFTLFWQFEWEEEVMADVGDGVRRSCHFPAYNCIQRQDKQQPFISFFKYMIVFSSFCIRSFRRADTFPWGQGEEGLKTS